jgi:hypothetical protein
LLLLICFNVKIFILFKLVYVVVKLYQCDDQNEYCYVEVCVFLYTNVYKKTYYTYEVDEKTVPNIILTNLFQIMQFFTILKSLGCQVHYHVNAVKNHRTYSEFQEYHIVARLWKGKHYAKNKHHNQDLNYIDQRPQTYSNVSQLNSFLLLEVPLDFIN